MIFVINLWYFHHKYFLNLWIYFTSLSHWCISVLAIRNMFENGFVLWSKSEFFILFCFDFNLDTKAMIFVLIVRRALVQLLTHLYLNRMLSQSPKHWQHRGTSFHSENLGKLQVPYCSHILLNKFIFIFMWSGKFALW